MEPVNLSFADLIRPLKPETFLDDYWEKKYLHISHQSAQRFEDLFSLRDIDRWLLCVRSGMPDSILLAAPQGSESGTERFRPQDSVVDHVYDAFSKGHSVVLNYLEDSWPPLAQLVRSLNEAFAAQVGVNVYLTPKGSQTFPVHVDEHDVFVLQVQGEKIWRLYEMQELTVMRRDYKADLFPTEEAKKDFSGTPLIAELKLQPGDLLYVPRGMPHCAIARDTTSLHLTVSVTPLYWFDFLKAAVEQTLAAAPELRKSLPPGFVQRPELAEVMRAQFDQVLRDFQSHLSFDDTLDVLKRNRVRKVGFGPDGHFSHINDLEGLDIESMVERRDNLFCVVEGPKDNFCYIRFGTRHVRGPVRLQRAMEFIRDHPRFKVADLPGLDDQGKQVFVRRLIREGLLRFAETPVRAGRLELVAQSA
ncbi:MAG TPA: cupin domain-containing protein [Thermoanaerobaculia bacterium]|jgi:ribosomal protein L16 Arg81 hydroxylase|nr:cupin domain-containing protein [Thermoanaerobaculia bacterium]